VALSSNSGRGNKKYTVHLSGEMAAVPVCVPSEPILSNSPVDALVITTFHITGWPREKGGKAKIWRYNWKLDLEKSGGRGELN